MSLARSFAGLYSVCSAYRSHSGPMLETKTSEIECFQMKLSDFSGKQWRILLILMLVNFVNYVDRQIVFALFPSIRREFGLSYVQLGYLATAFTVVLSVASFPLGMLADRISRRAVISAGVLFWSGATFFSGLAGSFRALLIARGLVGIGEAAYTPAGAAVISAAFPREIRPRVQGAFDAGMFVGGATGIALGGIIAATFGWRYAFCLSWDSGSRSGPHRPATTQVGSQRRERVYARA